MCQNNTILFCQTKFSPYFCVKFTQTTKRKNMAKFEYDYPHPAVATDCVVFGFDGRDLKVLLIQRGIEPFKGMWAFPGGFIRMEETAEECAIRELKEETGLTLTNIRQLGTFSGVHRDPRERIISIAFYALARQSEVLGGDDAAYARWWSIDDVPQLAFDHDYILRQAMRRIRQDIHFEPIGFGLLEEEFTIADLQRLYESILGVHFDRRNFHRKMIQTGILQEADEEETTKEMNAPSRLERLRRIKELLNDSDKESTDVHKEQFFGQNQEMKTQEFDLLFECRKKEIHRISPESDNTPYASDSIDETGCKEESVDNGFDPVPRTVGRKGKRFRFNKENYERLKDEENFRLEF